ncbi:flagellar hook-length control protein FliK [Candidimonas sp. SYP-B2681]|uniref:flagellar hook-length control protein FliK n=1 Tax=Candidimonas sp. SYP-B2681 TaxID=2497686 RepID=UPI000F861CD9|nr:flagellar hook-length control protein FliK [Candidimonas sp. SYP-B2681]RTZ47568.1 flagellar hook-length control protein FliK [Candidimonas sp. SYP-B2681]
MSIGGPSALGTLLVHRLDSVLGTTLSQQANLVSGARPDAVTQPGSAERADPAQNDIHRQPRDGVDRATAQTEEQTRQAINRAKIDARMAELLAARSAPDTSTTKSAPTSLGHAARTILALLANSPEQAPAVLGQRPLLPNNPLLAQGKGTGTSVASGANPAGPSGTTQASARNPMASATPAAGSAASSEPKGQAQTGSNALGRANATSMLTPNAGSVPAQLAQALAHAVKNSGLFYESHLHSLAFGKQSPAQLQQEPQAQVGRGRTDGTPAGNSNSAGTAASPSTTATTASQASHTSSADQTAQITQGHRGEAIAGQNTASASTSGAANPGAPVPVPGLDPQTHQLVRQQLEVLANQTFAWRGEAWPNAPMEWEINRREPSRDDVDLSPEAEHWATRINIQLPVLGNVQARLTLAGQQLVMQLIAPESSELLSEHVEALRSRFSARGMQLSQLSVASNAWESAMQSQQAQANANSVSAAASSQQYDASETPGLPGDGSATP